MKQIRLCFRFFKLNTNYSFSQEIKTLSEVINFSKDPISTENIAISKIPKNLEKKEKIPSKGSKKEHIEEIIKNACQSENWIHDIEKIYDFSIQKTENYIEVLSVLQKNRDFNEKFRINFHERILSHFSSHNMKFDVFSISHVYTYMNQFFKNQQLEKHFANEISKMEDEFIEFANDEHYIYTFASRFPQKFAKLLTTSKIDISSIDLIDSLVMKLWQYLNEQSATSFLQNLIKISFFDKIKDFFYFNDHIDTFLRISIIIDPSSLFKENNVDETKINHLILETTKKIFQFGSSREIKQFFPKFIEFRGYFDSLENDFVLKIFEAINIESFSRVHEKGCYVSYVILLNYIYLASKLKLPINKMGFDSKILEMHHRLESDPRFAERASDKDCILLMKILYLLNYNYLSHEHKENPNLELNDKLISFVDFKLKKMVYLKSMKMKITLKVFMFLRCNFLGPKREKSEVYLINIKRMEFLIASLLPKWRFNEKDAVYLKTLLNFCNDNKIGANSFKELIRLSLENANEDERRRTYNRYMEVKKAKIGLENKIVKTQKNK